MQEYELAILLHPDLEIDQAKALGKVEDLIKTAEGKVLARDDWGKRKLAYPIKKQQFALYYFYHVSLPPEGINELERGLLIMGELLRHMIVKYQAIPEADQPEAEDESEAKAAKPRVADTAKEPAAASTKSKEA